MTNRLIEESKSASSPHIGPGRLSAAYSACQICQKSSHTMADCYLNPISEKSRVNVPPDTVRKILDGKTQKKRRNDNKKKKGEERSAMARGQPKKLSGRNVDKMMLDSGTTPYLTPHADRVQCKMACDVPITLADESTVRATHKGIRKVDFPTGDGAQKLSLSDTLVVPDAVMSLVSVPSLVKKDIGVLFTPSRAVLFDLRDDMRTLGYATQDKDGLFYIADDCKTTQPIAHADEEKTSTMMVVIRDKSPDGSRTRVMESRVNGIASGYKDQSDGSDSITEVPRGAAKATDTLNDSSERTRASASQETGEEKKISTNGWKGDEIVKTWHLRLGHALPLKDVRQNVKEGLLPHVSCTSIHCEACLKGKYKRRFSGSLTRSTEPDTLYFDTKGKIETESVIGHYYFVTIVEEHSRFIAVRQIRSKEDASYAVLSYIRYIEKQSGCTVKRVHTDGGSEFKRALDTLKDQGVHVSITTSHTPESNGLAERTHSTILGLARTCLAQAKLPLQYWEYAVKHVADCKNSVRHSVKNKAPCAALYGCKPAGLHYLRPFGCAVAYRPCVKQQRTFAPRVHDGICLYHEGGGVFQVLTEDGVVRTKHARPMEGSFPGLAIFREGNVPEQAAKGPDDTVEVPFNTDDDTVQRTADGDSTTVSSDLDMLTYVPTKPSKHVISDDNEATEDSSSEVENDDDKPTARTGAEVGGYSLRPRGNINYSCAARTDIVDLPDEPKLAMALKSADSHKWLEAIGEEFRTIGEHGTWTDSTKRPPKGVTVLPSGIVLRVKRDSSGHVAKFKARLVVRGNFQAVSTDCAELYAPVACIELVHLMFAVAVVKNWSIEQVDVKSGFLHARLPND